MPAFCKNHRLVAKNSATLRFYSFYLNACRKNKKEKTANRYGSGFLLMADAWELRPKSFYFILRRNAVYSNSVGEVIRKIQSAT